jgi:serine protease Do
VELGPIEAAYSQQTGISQRAGLMVKSVEPGGPALAAGIRVGDIVRAVNNSQIQDTLDVSARLWSGKAGDVVRISFTRVGQQNGILTARNGETDVEVR